MTKPLIIAVDGPSASGKGTLARALAQHYGLRHLDTGKLYRIVALTVLEAGQDPSDVAAAEQAAMRLDLDFLQHHQLGDEYIGAAASVVSAHPGVRSALLAFQRDFAIRPPGAVLDGRDIGTIICPDADAKLYLLAHVAVRAQRRASELALKGQPRPIADIEAELTVRDSRDMGRAVAPLRPAPDALLLDSSNLDRDAVVSEAIRLVDARLLEAQHSAL